MVFHGLYSFLFPENESNFGKIGIKITEYEGFMKFIKNSPIKALKPHITERQELEESQADKEYYLNGINSYTERVPGPVSYVIEGLAYSYNKKGFFEFWSKLSKFTEPFSFKHSSRGYGEDKYEYVVLCKKGHITVLRLKQRESPEAEKVEEYTPAD